MDNTMFWNNFEQASDDEKIQMLKDGVEQGDALCQFGYGNYLASIDPEDTEWLKASAVQGFAVAQHALGLKKNRFWVEALAATQRRGWVHRIMVCIGDVVRIRSQRRFFQ